MHRRCFLSVVGTAAFGSVAGCVGRVQSPTARLPRSTTGPSAHELDHIDETITGLMDAADIPGGSAAVVKNGALVHARGYGHADVETREPVQPDSLFRIASLSKPITATAVLRLVEAGRLAIDDTVSAVLSELIDATRQLDPRLDRVTVRHLLEHSGGWDTGSFVHDVEPHWDPVENPDYIATAHGENSPAGPESIARYILGQPLHFDPGTRFSYSNAGYILLGRIIESVSGQPYEQFVRDDLLDEMHISRMQIGSTRAEELVADEVRYYDHDHAQTVESVFPGDGLVDGPYGDFSIEAMDASGGWVGSSIDLVRFGTRVIGSNNGPPPVTAETLTTMTRRPNLPRWQSPGSYYYAGGWFISPIWNEVPRSRLRLAAPFGSVMHTWWHDGQLPGTFSYLVRIGYANIVCSVVFNSRPWDLGFGSTVRRIVRHTLESTKRWPNHDLFKRGIG